MRGYKHPARGCHHPARRRDFPARGTHIPARGLRFAWFAFWIFLAGLRLGRAGEFSGAIQVARVRVRRGGLDFAHQRSDFVAFFDLLFEALQRFLQAPADRRHSMTHRVNDVVDSETDGSRAIAEWLVAFIEILPEITDIVVVIRD